MGGADVVAGIADGVAAGVADGAGAAFSAGAAVSDLAAEREHPARKHDETARSAVRKREVVTGMARWNTTWTQAGAAGRLAAPRPEVNNRQL